MMACGLVARPVYLPARFAPFSSRSSFVRSLSVLSGVRDPAATLMGVMATLGWHASATCLPPSFLDRDVAAGEP